MISDLIFCQHVQICCREILNFEILKAKFIAPTYSRSSLRKTTRGPLGLHQDINPIDYQEPFKKIKVIFVSPTQSPSIAMADLFNNVPL